MNVNVFLKKLICLNAEVIQKLGSYQCKTFYHLQLVKTTSRERPKSALYLRPKTRKLFKNMLRTYFKKNSQKKIQNTQRVPLVLGKRFRNSDIAC